MRQCWWQNSLQLVKLPKKTRAEAVMERTGVNSCTESMESGQMTGSD